MNETPAKKPKRAKPWECTYLGCDRTFCKRGELKEHTDYVHKKIYHNVCDYVNENGETCGRTFERMSELTLHKKKHNPELKIPCTCCTRRFYSQDRLQNHVDFVAGIFHNVCDYVNESGETCGKTFEEASDLKKHKKRHNPELKIPCACCTKLFIAPSQLQNHVDFVNGIFHNVCDYVNESGETCGKTFEEAGHLATHKKVHNPGLKIPCGCCTRRFYTQSKLQLHVDYVAGIFHNVCEYVDKNGETCGKTFEEAKNLADHTNIHIRDAQRDMTPMEDHHVLETRHTVQRWE